MGVNAVIDSLIYDRTQADVDYAVSLMQNGVHTEESLRGAYNATDRNRVGSTINYVSELMREIGMSEAQLYVKSDWDIYGIIRKEDNDAVLSALRLLKIWLSEFEIGEVPDSLDGLTFQKANDIERILYNIFGIYLRLTELHAGDGYTSEFDASDEQIFDNYWGE